MEQAARFVAECFRTQCQPLVPTIDRLAHNVVRGLLTPHLKFMFVPDPPKSEEVEHLLRNAQLRDELEPLFDESIDRVNPTAMSTRSENEFLESMLEWERAPMLP